MTSDEFQIVLVKTNGVARVLRKHLVTFENPFGVFFSVMSTVCLKEEQLALRVDDLLPTLYRHPPAVLGHMRHFTGQ